MANYANLKATINANIKANGAEEITGPILNNVLNAAVNALGDGWQYMGVATPATSPGTPDANVFYIASTAGTYTNFGGLSVAEGEVAILKWNGSWAKEVTGAATAAQVTQLGQDVGTNKTNITNLQQEIDEIQPIVIEGNVTNAPDEEDITTDENDLLKFADRPTAVNQMGYVILRKNKTFAEQVADANTIYEIRYNFTIDENMTLPSDIALLFNGGEIGGSATLTFNETTILGNAKITCEIAGSISGLVHAEWFGMVENDQTFDNSPVIQKVCKTFPFVTIEGSDYYCATPIDLYTSALYGLSISANLHYITSGSDTFITIGRPYSLDIRIYGKIIGPVANNTGGSDRTIGIKFHDMNNSRVYVNAVQRFYTNVQVYSGTAGIGNAYNTYEFVELSAANILLELKSDNPGWVTSNRFSINRMTTYGGYTNVETAILIHADAVGFSDIVFDKLCIEGVRDSEPVKIINANNISFYNVRNESNNANFFYTDNVSNIKTRFNYGIASTRAEPGTICDIIDMNDEYAPFIPLDGAIDIPGGSGQMLLFNAIDSTKAQNVNYSPISYTPIGFIVPASRKPRRFISKDPFDVTVVYYDSSLNPISRDTQYMPAGTIAFQNSSSTSRAYVSTSMSTIQSVSLPTLPEGCSYVGYFFRTTKSRTNFNGNTPIFSVPADLTAAIIKTMFTYGPCVNHNEYGTTAQRPKFTENYRQFLVGFEYFDTSLGKPIYAKSIASDGTATWVDSTGATI